MNRDDAIARAISHVETAEQLLSVDDALAGSTPDGHAKAAEEGPYGVYEQQRAARYTGATAHATVAQVWATLALQLETRQQQDDLAARGRHWDESDRRSRT